MEIFDGLRSELGIKSAEYGNGPLIKLRRKRLNEAFFGAFIGASFGAFCLTVASQAAISAESPALAPAPTSAAVTAPTSTAAPGPTSTAAPGPTSIAAPGPTSIAATVPAPIAGRTYVLPDNYDPSTAPPFSNGVLVSGTFYVAGHLGLDPATGEAAADAPTEARLVMEAVKRTLAKTDLTIDDLVSVTVYCTDLSLYGTFNEVYKTFFHGKFPARAFIGVDKLVRNARFEVAGVAVQPPAARMRHAH